MTEPELNNRFDPFYPAFRNDPFPFYRALLGGPPRMVNMISMPIALVARYDDAVAVLRDPERFSSRPLGLPGVERPAVFEGVSTLLFSDPPVHTRLRRLVSRSFSARRIAGLEGRIREITSSLLDSAPQGSFDLMESLAAPLPVMAIAELLGVRSSDYRIFKTLADDLMNFTSLGPLGLAAEQARNAASRLSNHFALAIEERRAMPGDDLISSLIAAHEEHDALSEKEMLAFLVLLLVAGSETTTNLIGSGVLALLRNPDQLHRLRRQPELIQSAVEEMLRYDGPGPGTTRFCTVDTVVGRTAIQKGTFVMVLTAAANRDPAYFSEPDKFDITREPNEHLAFSEGIHFCLGAPLARLEGSIAIREVLMRFANLRLANPQEAVEYKSFFLRGPGQLVVTAR